MLALGPEGAVRLIEEHAGDDLQYIRVNGTVVGGLAGGAIYGVASAARPAVMFPRAPGGLAGAGRAIDNDGRPAARSAGRDPSTMRYRRLSYRYTVLAGSTSLWSAAVWREEGQPVTFGPGQRRPDADVCETSADIAVDVDLAGVGEDDFEIQLFDDALVIEGTRQLPVCGAGGVYHAAGIRQGPFRLELPLPVPVDAARVEARHERGLLHVVLPKAARGRAGGIG